MSALGLLATPVARGKQFASRLLMTRSAGAKLPAIETIEDDSK
jgi:hypothetical protein